MKLFETVTKEQVLKRFELAFDDLRAREKAFQIQVGMRVWDDLNKQRNLYHDKLGESLEQMLNDFRGIKKRIEESDTSYQSNSSYVYANIMECVFDCIGDGVVFNKMMNQLISWLAYVEIVNSVNSNHAKV
jgi:hypothetical protein